MALETTAFLVLMKVASEMNGKEHSSFIMQVDSDPNRDAK